MVNCSFLDHWYCLNLLLMEHELPEISNRFIPSSSIESLLPFFFFITSRINLHQHCHSQTNCFNFKIPDKCINLVHSAKCIPSYVQQVHRQLETIYHKHYLMPRSNYRYAWLFVQKLQPSNFDKRFALLNWKLQEWLILRLSSIFSEKYSKFLRN